MKEVIIQRVKAIIEEYGLSKSAFAKRIGMEQTTVNNQLLGKRGVSFDLARKTLSAFPDISPGWLLTGEGEMLKSENAGSSTKRADDDIGKFDERYITYLLPLSAMGGSLVGFQDKGVKLYQCERIISPIKDVDFAITVYGDSMAPEYPSGSMILIKKIDPSIFIDWGKVYVLDTLNGAIVKKLHRCEEEGWVTCHSINPAPKYADFNVRLSDIRGIYRVLMCLSSK